MKLLLGLYNPQRSREWTKYLSNRNGGPNEDAMESVTHISKNLYGVGWNENWGGKVRHRDGSASECGGGFNIFGGTPAVIDGQGTSPQTSSPPAHWP